MLYPDDDATQYYPDPDSDQDLDLLMQENGAEYLWQDFGIPRDSDEQQDYEALQWWESVAFPIAPASKRQRSVCEPTVRPDRMSYSSTTVAEVATPEVQFDSELVPFLTGRQSQDGEVLVAQWVPSGQQWTFVVERDTNNLTPAEEKEHHDLVKAAKLKELQAWHDLGAWTPVPRAQGRNPMSGRWVLKWKYVDGKRIVKARLVIRGFLDKQQSNLDTSSFTARRTSQRLVVSVVVQHGWELFSWDISNAFLQGLTFDEIAKSSDEPLREVCLDPPPDVYNLLRELGPQYKGVRKLCNFLKLFKGAYGLKNAPKLWKRRLQQELVRQGGKQSHLYQCVCGTSLRMARTTVTCFASSPHISTTSRGEVSLNLLKSWSSLSRPLLAK